MNIEGWEKHLRIILWFTHWDLSWWSDYRDSSMTSRSTIWFTSLVDNGSWKPLSGKLRRFPCEWSCILRCLCVCLSWSASLRCFPHKYNLNLDLISSIPPCCSWLRVYFGFLPPSAGFLLLSTDDWCPGVGVGDVMSQACSISLTGEFTRLRLSPRDKPTDLSCLLHLWLRWQ